PVYRAVSVGSPAPKALVLSSAVMVRGAGLMTKVWKTSGAGLWVPSPAWDALIVTMPAPVILTAEFATTSAGGGTTSGTTLNVTGRPEEAVAWIGNGKSP